MASSAEEQYQAPKVEAENPENPLKGVEDGYVPEGYASVEEFLQYAREAYQDDLEADKTNRDMALEDLEFIAGKQWDPIVEKARAGRPIVTINTLPQFIGQVIGDRRMNSTSIKVSPLIDASQEDAQKRAAIIKGIEYRSRATRAYDMGAEHQISCGMGNARVHMDWADDDVFEQDIFISPIANPLAVIWDRFSVDPTGRDASRCFVEDNLDEKTFDKEWPDKRPDEGLVDKLNLSTHGWFRKNNVRVTEFWEMVYREKIIALLADGSIKDITGQDVQQLLEQNALFIDQATQKPRIRHGQCRYARMHLITGADILSGPYELPINRLPIVRFEGRIVPVGEDRVRYSLVRWQKEPARMRNYWRSQMIEALAMAPKAKWLAEDAALEGYEEDFRNAATSMDPVLKYKQGATKPEQIDPPKIDAALLQQIAMNTQDLKDTSGLQDASLGIKSNEVSGVAIRGRQQEGDVATFIYHDNTNAAILEIGDVVDQLLPVCYDTTRTLLAVGVDNKQTSVPVNDPNNADSFDLTKGKYTIAIETGPSFTTQRQEGAQAMMEMIKVAPELMTIAADLITKNLDFPGAIEISERLRTTLEKQGAIPTSVTEQEKPQPLTPELAQQIGQSAVQEFLQSLQGQEAALGVRAKTAQAAEAEAKAERARHEADRADVLATKEASLLPIDVHKAAKPDKPAPKQPDKSGARPRGGKGKTKGNSK